MRARITNVAYPSQRLPCVSGVRSLRGGTVLPAIKKTIRAQKVRPGHTKIASRSSDHMATLPIEAELYPILRSFCTCCVHRGSAEAGHAGYKSNYFRLDARPFGDLADGNNGRSTIAIRAVSFVFMCIFIQGLHFVAPTRSRSKRPNCRCIAMPGRTPLPEAAPSGQSCMFRPAL